MISYLTLEATADVIVNNGLATDDEVKTALVSPLAYTQDPTTVIGDPRVFPLWAHKQPVTSKRRSARSPRDGSKTDLAG